MSTVTKVRLTTSFALLKKAHACADQYRHLAEALGGIDAYGKDTPIPLARIIDTNGITDAIWALCACAEESAVVERIARLFAADCAESVLHLYEKEYPKDKRPHNAIQAARDFVNGEITVEEFTAAGDAARAAASAAWDAAWAAAWAAEKEKQKEFLLRYIK